MAPEVLADPIGVVVDLVAGVEPALDREVIAEVAAGVGGGRVKRRRLAQTLRDRPGLLVDGRSPAPRVVADPLIALRKAGASRVSAPVCAECGKGLRTVQRRGEDWYCGVCGPRREPCAACGQLRRVSRRDRAGWPRCAQCPPNDGHDPVDVVVEVATGVDPSLSADLVAAAVRASVPRAGQRHQLAWALAGRPSLLTGAGAEASVPSVLRLIDKLCDAGTQKITHPACPRCHRVVHLHRRVDGQWLCRNCVAKSRAQPCARCGTVREAATRDEHGHPLCPYCLISDPANHETCIACSHARRVSVRTPDGPLCPTCRPWKTLDCAICGRTAPCTVSTATGQPWCLACQKRWARCHRCGNVRPVRGGTLAEPLCATCARPDPEFWRMCPTCGQNPQLRSGPCVRCTVRERLRDLLADHDGAIRPELQALYDNLANYERPTTVLGWLSKSTAPAILRELGTGRRPLTHAALDALPASKPIDHLRSVLVATNALPARDEHMARLERWITRVITERADPDQQHLPRRYALWHLLRRLRGRLKAQNTTHDQAVTVQQHVRAALTVLDWLTAQDLTLSTAQQRDLESWLASEDASHRREAGHFVRWANKHKLTRLEFPAVKWAGPSGTIDTETRWEQARWLLHDDTVQPEDRVAGLLVLLYAQWAAAISRLTLDHIQTSNDEVRIRLGREPVVLPEPLAGLILELHASRRGHAALGTQGSSPWLFPGGQPGRPISAFRMAERLRKLGIRSGQSRSTALFQLATELPAAILARMLGIHISVAVAWQRASAGDWMTYAADFSRRARGGHQPTNHEGD
jgi:hypothetical protein